MGYRVRNPSEALALLDEAAAHSIHLACFFAFDDRPSHRKAIDNLNKCAGWLDELSFNKGVISILFARSETQFAADYRPFRMETIMPPIHYAKEQLMATSKLYINPSLQIAKALGLNESHLPAIILFDPRQSNTVAKYSPVSLEIFESQSLLEDFLMDLFSSFSEQKSLTNKYYQGSSIQAFRWRELPFDLEAFRRNCNDILQRASHQTIRIREFNRLPYEERKSVNIFISYASEDRLDAKIIYKHLSEVGFDPWIDVCKLVGGELWDRRVMKALNQADFFLACLSTESVKKRGYVQREFKRALELWETKLLDDIYVIPVKLDQCEVPADFRRFQWIDYEYGGGLVEIVECITEGLRRLGRYDINET